MAWVVAPNDQNFSSRKNIGKIEFFSRVFLKGGKCLPEVEFFPYVFGLSFLLEFWFFLRPVLKKRACFTNCFPSIGLLCDAKWTIPIQVEGNRNRVTKLHQQLHNSPSCTGVSVFDSTCRSGTSFWNIWDHVSHIRTIDVEICARDKREKFAGHWTIL